PVAPPKGATKPRHRGETTATSNPENHAQGFAVGRAGRQSLLQGTIEPGLGDGFAVDPGQQRRAGRDHPDE
ncbi:hypothetical protein, partial [Thiobacter aerophilum]